jgi:hypothetical protein
LISLRSLAHVAALIALATIGLVVGRFIRHPDASGAAFVVLVAAAVAALLWRLYRPGGVASLKPAPVEREPRRRQTAVVTESAMTQATVTPDVAEAPVEPAPAPEPAPEPTLAPEPEPEPEPEPAEAPTVAEPAPEAEPAREPAAAHAGRRARSERPARARRPGASRPRATSWRRRLPLLPPAIVLAIIGVVLLLTSGNSHRPSVARAPRTTPAPARTPPATPAPTHPPAPRPTAPAHPRPKPHAPPAATTGIPSARGLGSGTLKRGATGPQVKVLQRLLGIAPTGRFDAHTEAAVRRFQQSNGLPATGVVAKLTHAALKRAFP